MKNIKNKMLLKLSLLTSISIFLFTSCSNDSGDSSGKIEVTGISRSVVDDPLVEGDRKVDVPTDVIVAGNYYIIRGSGFGTLKSISFNGMESYFNPTLVTDNVIVIMVDQKTPYYNEMDEMKIVTNAGTLNYTVAIRPPNPNIKGFPINSNPGDIITITGEYFLHPKVNFGETEVELISSTLTEIKVKVPDNVQYKKLAVTNVSGTTVAGQSFGSAIYDDAYTNLMKENGLWRPETNHYDIAYDKDASQGTKCINWTSGPDWDGLWINIDGSKVDMSKYKGIRVSIKGKKAGSVTALINDNWGATASLKFGTSWTYLEILFSGVGNPTELKQVLFQETGGFGGNDLYIDDIGLILK